MATHSKPPQLRLIRGGNSPPFDSYATSVLISEIERGGVSSTKLRELSTSIRSKIASLESELEHDAKDLRSGLHSFLVAMASSRKDELRGSGVVFRDPSDPKITVSLVSGETDSSTAQTKIDTIIASCIEVARADIEFLQVVLVSIEQSRSVPPDQLPKLKDILEKNSYWRFVEPT
ncbi:MAG: hypothetical protein ABID61_02700 [Candidatus Micrarchaeota archaeon]